VPGGNDGNQGPGQTSNFLLEPEEIHTKSMAPRYLTVAAGNQSSAKGAVSHDLEDLLGLNALTSLGYHGVLGFVPHTTISHISELFSYGIMPLAHYAGSSWL